LYLLIKPSVLTSRLQCEVLSTFHSFQLLFH